MVGLTDEDVIDDLCIDKMIKEVILRVKEAYIFSESSVSIS